MLEAAMVSGMAPLVALGLGYAKTFHPTHSQPNTALRAVQV